MRTPAVLLAIMLSTLACSATPEPTSEPTAAHSQTASGPFLFSLDLPSDTWAAGQPIIGEAALSLTQGNARELRGSVGGIIGFNYVEVSGRRRMGAFFDQACGQHHLADGAPIASALQVSASFADDDPDADFYRSFVSAGFVALPAGIWDITAVAYFVDWPTCGPGREVTMQTTVRVRITP